MNTEKMQKMKACSHLLPDPGGEVVRECLGEIETRDRLLELAWGVIANAHNWDGAGNKDWKPAAERWRDRYFALTERESEGGEG